MTEKQKQTKLAKLKDRLSSLESKLFDARREEIEKVNRQGWGYGMRHSKIGFSTRKSDRIRERIETCKRQIAELM